MQQPSSAVNVVSLTPPNASEALSSQESLYRVAWQILGGEELLGPRPGGPLDLHFALLKGIPYASLLCMLRSLSALPRSEVGEMLGVSSRTLSRYGDAPDRAMPAQLASRVWTLAEALSVAIQVFGGAERAQSWMTQAAVGLDGQRPIDMLRTSHGAELVKEFLTRLEYGVYS